jgi:hypothetical protein
MPFVGAEPQPGPVRVVHSPNHRYFKGTRFVEQAVTTLREQGYDVELELVEGLSNEEARQRYAAADIVFAQCLAGSLGFTELEGMAAGKPVLGYIRDPHYYAHTDELPLVSASPETLESELARLVADGELRAELGRRGRRYVEREWSYDALAPAYEALHDGVWEHNDLRSTLRRKFGELARGESRHRVGRPLTGSDLREWPVWSDPATSMRRIARGAYGQPPFDESGIPRVALRGRYGEHPGVVARYALHAFHLALLEPGAGEHERHFLDGARWLRDRLEMSHDGVGRWLHRFPAEADGWVTPASQGLGLSVLLRAEQRRPGEGFGTAADAAARLFGVEAVDGGLLTAGPPSELIGAATGLLALHEHARATGEEWTAELFERAVGVLARAAPGVPHDPAEAPAATPDAAYFVVQQLLALHRISGRPELQAEARRRARILYTSRARAVLRLEEPI